MQPPSRPLVRSGSAGSNPPRQPQTPHQQQSPRPATNSFAGAQNNTSNPNPRPPLQQFNQNRNSPAPPPAGAAQSHNSGQSNTAAPPETVGFFSARAVTHIPEEAIANGHIAPKGGQVFNPRAESPSIRKTPGIDHTKSKPLARNGQHVPPPASGDATTGSPSGGTAPSAAKVMQRPGPPMARGNVVNPQLDHTRRIGAPGSSSPLANRNQYRPPTMKRPSGGDSVLPPNGRPPLADVSINTPADVGAEGLAGPDFKRQKMG